MAIIGDAVGFSIGYKAGPMIFTRQQSILFRKDHLVSTQKFYEKHGGKTIIIARFMPAVRTFAPVVAGVGRMGYRRFAMFNILGGVGWVVSMTLPRLLPGQGVRRQADREDRLPHRLHLDLAAHHRRHSPPSKRKTAPAPLAPDAEALAASRLLAFVFAGRRVRFAHGGCGTGR